MSTYSLTIDAPRWFRFRPLRWLARETGVSRRWEAQGETLDEFDADVRRLADRLGIAVEDSPRGYSLIGPMGQSFTVEVHG